MAKHILSNALILFHQHNISATANSVTTEYAAEALEDTTLADASRSRLGGLKTASIGAEGFFDADPYDDALFSAMGADGKLIVVSYSADEGARAYMLESSIGEYQPFGNAVGELASFSLNAGAQGNMIRGTLMINRTATATGNGGDHQLGAVATGKKLYGTLHVLAVSGTTPTLDVTVSSDAASDFATPATRLTFSQFTAAGAEQQTADGPITDDWYRINWTIGGTSPSFQFAVFLGTGD